jgi:hypothetical protein
MPKTRATALDLWSQFHDGFKSCILCGQFLYMHTFKHMGSPQQEIQNCEVW